VTEGSGGTSLRQICGAGAIVLGGLIGVAAWRIDVTRRVRFQAATHRALVEVLLNMLSAGDAATERHSRRVAELTDALAATYGFRGEGHARLRLAALLHDLGKIDEGIFDVLHSCEPLSDEGRQRMEEHPGESARILAPLEDLHPGITGIVSSHHEAWNGGGYPLGLGGEAIPLEARLISVADVFDALTQSRSYRDALPPEVALDEISKGAGRRFDPEVVARLSRQDVLDRWIEVMEGGRTVENERSA
jgi:putative nucleotidyltransferase with HDIG domain